MFRSLKTVAGALLFALSCAACAGHQPTLSEQALQPRRAVVVAGTVQRLQRDWTYEAPCGIISSILRRCDDVRAFTGEIVDSMSRTTQFMYFQHSDGGPHPANGDHGTVVLHWGPVYRYLTCAQRAAVTSACMAEFTWLIESDMDMDLVS